MVEQQEPTAYVNPYKFNAKELDSETGLYYYGARYYNPRLSIWYGVDPLAEKYPSWNPYVYTFNNPIRFIDPNGMEAVDPGGPGPRKLSGSKNLLIYILDKNPLSASYMNKGAKNWDYIGVKSINDVQSILESHYGKNIPVYENLAIKSHGTWGGAKLNPGNSNEEFVFDAKKSTGLNYISQHLSDDANILFTGCNMTLDYRTNPQTQANIDSYTDLFLEGNRKIFFNGATSGSNMPILDNNKNIIGETFLFDTDLVKENGKNYSGFMQFNLNSKGNSVFRDRLFNIKVRSYGGFERRDFMENKKVINNGIRIIKK